MKSAFLSRYMKMIKLLKENENQCRCRHFRKSISSEWCYRIPTDSNLKVESLQHFKSIFVIPSSMLRVDGVT